MLRSREMLPLMEVEPSLPEMLSNLARDTTQWVSAGLPVTDKTIALRRYEACQQCDHWHAGARLGLGKCDLCGCTKFKIHMATTTCRLGKWNNL